MPHGGPGVAEGPDVQVPDVLREFTEGGLVKGGLAIYAFPLCNCNALASPLLNPPLLNLPL